MAADPQQALQDLLAAQNVDPQAVVSAAAAALAQQNQAQLQAQQAAATLAAQNHQAAIAAVVTAGGVWSHRQRPPVHSPCPLQSLVQRVLRHLWQTQRPCTPCIDTR